MSIFVDFDDENSEVLWGKLVKSWVKGKSEFSQIKDNELRVPRDLDDLRAQCAKVGVNVTIPDTYTKLAVVQYGPETLVVRLPEKSELQAAEELLAAGTYKLPRFYATFLGPLDADGQGELLKFQAARIGDYAVATCM